jgi:hypothetical protein
LSDYKHIPQNILDEDIAKLILYSAAYVRGVFPCNKFEYKRMIRALEIGGVKPVIDKVSFQLSTVGIKADTVTGIQVRKYGRGISVHEGR